MALGTRGTEPLRPSVLLQMPCRAGWSHGFNCARREPGREQETDEATKVVRCGVVLSPVSSCAVETCLWSLAASTEVSLVVPVKKTRLVLCGVVAVDGTSDPCTCATRGDCGLFVDLFGWHFWCPAMGQRCPYNTAYCVS